MDCLWRVFEVEAILVLKKPVAGILKLIRSGKPFDVVFCSVIACYNKFAVFNVIVAYFFNSG